MLKQSEKLEEAAKGKDLSDVNDSSCTNGHDDEGATGYEIFTNGYELAVRAKGRDVWLIPQEEVSYFFFGTEEEVLARVLAAPDEDSEEE